MKNNKSLNLYHDDLEIIITSCCNLLADKKKTLAIAESCTGGLVSHLITNKPGSSAYLLLGIVAYSNKAKETLLNVPKSIIDKFGAVSSETAVKMASGVKKTILSDIGIGITGIAGPGGGSNEKPVGLVFIAVSSKVKTITKRIIFSGNREEIKHKTAFETFKLLKEVIT